MANFAEYWSVISVADDHMRHVQWNVVHDELRLDEPKDSTPGMPWGTVLADTAFGVTSGRRAQWWWTRVIGPLSRNNATSSSAFQTIDTVEGRMRQSSEPPFKKARGGASQFASTKPKTTAKQSKIDPATQTCFAWNDGGCGKKCLQGRLHRCKECNGDHRARDCPTTPGKAGGKGGKGNGGNHKKKKGGHGGKASSK